MITYTPANFTLITGNTYPVRAELKALGATWNKAAQGWNVPDKHKDEALLIVANAASQAPSPRYEHRAPFNRYRSNYTRFSSGAEVFTNKRGRCEDAPCCGCCS